MSCNSHEEPAMPQTKGQVIYGANADYVLPALVSIWSLHKNASQPVDVTLYVEDMGPHELDLIERVRDRLGVPVSGKSFDATGFEEYHQGNPYYPVVSLLPLILPRLVEGRCLFMDADTLVMGDVWELLSADLRGMPLGACVDMGQVTFLYDRILRIRASDVFRPAYARPKRIHNVHRMMNLGFIPGENYFNTGLLVMDCEMVRDRFPHWQSLASMDRLRLYTGMPDQDRMNEFFHGQWFQFPLKWNTRPGMKLDVEKRQYKFREISDSLRRQMQEAVEDTKVWHFMGKRKPWIPRYANSWRLKRRQGFRDYARALSEFNAQMDVE